MKITHERRLSATMTTQDSWFWHYRFCHLNLKRLIQLLEKELILWVPKFTMPEKSCEVCLNEEKKIKKFIQLTCSS